MKSPLRSFLAACAALAIATLAAGANAAQNSRDDGAVVAAKPARTPLEKGMDGETIRQIVGAPVEVQPIKAPDGVAEKWIYRRVLDRRTKQMVVGTLPVFCHYESPDWSDMPGANKAGISIRRNESTTVYQVTALLMFNNKLVVARQWKESKVNYNN